MSWGVMPVGLVVQFMKPFKLPKQAPILRIHPVIYFSDLGIAHSLNGVLFLCFHLSCQHLFHCLVHAYFAFNLHLSGLRSRHSDQCNAFSKNGVFSQWAPASKLSDIFPPKVRPGLSPAPLCDRPSSSCSLEGPLIGVYGSPC